MSAREHLLETLQLVLQRLPEDAGLRDLIEELKVMEAVEAGLRDVREGRVISFEEFKKRTEPCLSK